VDANSLRARLDAFPRVAIGRYPTPLEALPRLSEELGRPVYVKREDRADPDLGGNKARNLEYLVGHALERRATRLVTFGALHSNHARLTAEVARRHGLGAHVVYFDRRPASLPGNALRAEQAGARLHFVPLGGARRAGMTVETANRLVRLLALGMTGPHYFVPVGGFSWRGCLGPVRGALELEEQASALGIGNARVAVAAGTGATLAGVLAGVTLTGSALRPLGIDVGSLWSRFQGSIAALASEVCARLGDERTFAAADVPLIEHVYVGREYADPTEEGLAAAELVGRLEGITLDPVYTAKAFAGLLDLARREALGGDEPIVFLHTGGPAPAATGRP
jgi:1-aminocyclopropane-1-carboxylate deaminase/D-cysteine desulfhydrase-like pyridoxal-dependent ACC family enzyme